MGALNSPNPAHPHECALPHPLDRIKGLTSTWDSLKRPEGCLCMKSKYLSPQLSLGCPLTTSVYSGCTSSSNQALSFPGAAGSDLVKASHSKALLLPFPLKTSV